MRKPVEEGEKVFEGEGSRVQDALRTWEAQSKLRASQEKLIFETRSCSATFPPTIHPTVRMVLAYTFFKEEK